MGSGGGRKEGKEGRANVGGEKEGEVGGKEEANGGVNAGGKWRRQTEG